MSAHRFNLAGLTDLVEELAGNAADLRLPMVFELPDGTTTPWARLSIEVVAPGAEEPAGAGYRALVIRPTGP